MRLRVEGRQIRPVCLEEIVEGTGATFGVKTKLRITEGYPVLDNHAECAEAVARVAASIVGDGVVSADGLPMAGGEDFAYFTREIPGAYFLVGAKAPGEQTPICHHPDFDFDDDLIPLGVRMFLGIVEDRLRRHCG